MFKFIEAQAGYDLCPHLKNPLNCPALHHGLKIYSTLDLQKQAQALAAINDNASLLAEGGPTPASAGLASVQASTGDILALATSDQNFSQIRRTTRIRRPARPVRRSRCSRS